MTEDANPWAGKLLFYDPRDDGGVAIVAARVDDDWPDWSPEKARRQGLMCAGCDWDLRRRGEEQRAVFRLPHQGRKRLFCDRCADLP